MHNIRKGKLKAKDKTKLVVYVDNFLSLRNLYAFVYSPYIMK